MAPNPKKQAKDQDKAEPAKVDPPAPATAKELPNNFYQLAGQAMKDFRGLTTFSVVSSILGVVMFNGELRDLGASLARSGKRRFEKPANWTINHFNSAIVALMDGLLILVALAFVMLSASGQLPNYGDRFRIMGILLVCMAGLTTAIYAYCSDIILRLGFLWGFFSAEEVTAFKYEGGASVVRFAGGVARSGVSGSLQGLWNIGRKFGWVNCWLAAGSIYVSLLPFWRVPDLLWLASPLIIWQICGHTFREKAERGKEWFFKNFAFITLLVFMAILTIVPEGMMVLMVPLTAEHSLPIRIGTVIFFGLLFLVINAMANGAYKANKADGKPTEKGKSTGTPVSAGQLLLGVAALMMLGLVGLFGLWFFGFTYRASEGGTTISSIIDGEGNLQMPVSAFPPLPNLSGTAQAATPDPTPGSTPQSAAIALELNATFSEMASHLLVRKGVVISITITEGRYRVLGVDATVDGNFNGVKRLVSTMPNFKALFPAELYEQHPNGLIGQLFARTGSGKWQVVGSQTTLIADDDGRLVFQLMLPNYGSDISGEIKGELNVSVPH